MVKRLAALSHEQLLALLTELLDGVPDLSDWLETATRADGQVEPMWHGVPALACKLR